MGFALPKSSSLAPRESSTTITSTHRQPAIPALREYRPIDAALAIAQTVCMVIPVKNEARHPPIVFRSPHGWIDEIVLADGRSVDDAVAVTKECCPDIKIVHQIRAPGQQPAGRP